ncbi:MAG: DUF1993 family protein [Sandaracinaceae bacterium]
MDLHRATVFQMGKALSNLLLWLDKAADHARAKGFDGDSLLSSRLAPDQFTLVRQVQAACDTAKFAAARLAGREAPSHEDAETTLDELRARIRATTAFLETFDPAAFEGAEERTVPLPFVPDRAARGEDYLIEFAQPNFYFHLTTAYAILRHNGVELGKRDYIGSIRLLPA